jgi:ATP-binding protein involved in chromosome partitioning
MAIESVNRSEPQCAAQARRPRERAEDSADGRQLQSRMAHIDHKIMVLSGKGGVGKSTVAVNLATALALAGKRVGLLDIDIHGPSVPKLLHIEEAAISGTHDTLRPVELECGPGTLSVMSIGFLLRGRDEAVIWRGPMKFGVIKQFLKDVEWGTLDYLVVDSPPGTGDEPLAAVELIGEANGAVVVTTPQAMAVQDVRRCITFCRQVNLPVIGVVENMSGFSCPTCGERVHIFGADGGRAMAAEMGVPYLGAIPIEPDVVVSGDNGTPIVQAAPHSETAKAFGRIVRGLLAPELAAAAKENRVAESGRPMRIAVPVTGDVLSSHFGHCERFVLYDVSEDGETIGNRQALTPLRTSPARSPSGWPNRGRRSSSPGDGVARPEPVRAERHPGRGGSDRRRAQRHRAELFGRSLEDRRQHLRPLASMPVS